jgi:hypothetical protein
LEEAEMNRIRTVLTILQVAVLAAGVSMAQETRGTIFGRVTDASASAVAGAKVVVRNVQTNVTAPLVTNDTGYYEAPLLTAGEYEVSAESLGFKRIIRKGITLQLAAKLEINLALEIGAVSESISVTSDAPLLETNTVSSGRTMDHRSLQDLPTLNNNPSLLLAFIPGVVDSSSLTYNNPAFTLIGTSFSVYGNVGGNDYSIDGVPNYANNRRISYQPHTDAVDEFRVETSNFDGGVGHTTGASLNVMTKSGTNAYHGSGSEQYWSNQWMGADFFAKQNHYLSIAQANGTGNHALADQIAAQNYNPPGHSNNFSATLGGPMTIPKLYKGKDRTFFFFSYSGLKDRTVAATTYWNRTIPTLPERNGNFSDLLPAGAQFQVYDPLSVTADPSRPGHYVRTPFAGNILPQSRVNNPVYGSYLKFLPTPNNNPLSPSAQPLNNYVASSIPWRFNYAGYSGRIDHQQSEKNRFFFRTQWWAEQEYNQDWLYSTVPGAGASIGSRTGIGQGFDWVFTPSANTVWDFSVGYQSFDDAVVDVPARKIEPSAVGLPSYIDAKAGAYYTLPQMDFAGYNSLSLGYVGLPNIHRTGFAKLNGSHVHGRHTFRWGYDQQELFKSTFGFGTTGLNTSGDFGFDTTYTRRNDDTLTPAGSLGLSWAAFMMGIPSSMSIGTYDSAALKNSNFGWYGQDSWRVTNKLTLTLALRVEYETAPTERYNRALGYWDPSAQLPIGSAANAAYAANPIPELAASAFKVQGGNTYIGANGTPRTFWQNQLMWLPRLAAAYQMNDKTVIRGGYGIYYDSLTVRDFGYTFPSQQGYSVTTSTPVSNDFGQTFTTGNPYQGVSPLTNPFPVRSDGTRYNTPVGNALGAMDVVGGSFSYYPYDLSHARQQRWRISVQRQLLRDMMIDVSYAGSRTDDNYLNKSLDALPAQYWNTTNTRNNAIASNLSTNVANPFYIGNFSSLKTSNPLLYQNMSSLSFFTSPTITKAQLLLPYPQLTGLTDYTNEGKVKTHELEVFFTKRFSKGFNANIAYTRMYGQAADYYYNTFDTTASWEEASSTRPNHFSGSMVAELPFGKGKPLASRGIAAKIAGGFQLAGTYEYQSGPLLSFGNLFYNGNLADIAKGPHSLAEWFNTDNFVTSAAAAPASYQARVFPKYVDQLRAAPTSIWNSNIQREFVLLERMRLQFRFDVLNLFNHTTFAGPDTNPLNSTFGKVLSTTGQPRRLQIQVKLRF